MTLRHFSSIHHNTAFINGGGIFAGSGSVTLTDASTIHHNIAGSDGGGIYSSPANTLSPPGGGAHVTFNTPDNVS